jgi:hypothetical protein
MRNGSNIVLTWVEPYSTQNHVSCARLLKNLGDSQKRGAFTDAKLNTHIRSQCRIMEVNLPNLICSSPVTGLISIAVVTPASPLAAQCFEWMQRLRRAGNGLKVF